VIGAFAGRSENEKELSRTWVREREPERVCNFLMNRKEDWKESRTVDIRIQCHRAKKVK